MNENLSIFPAIMSGKACTFVFLEEDEQTKVLVLDGHVSYVDFIKEKIKDFDDSPYICLIEDKIKALEDACRQHGQVVTPDEY